MTALSPAVIDEPRAVRNAALDAANCWHETEAAQELLAKVDAYERLSDRWYSECREAAKGFSEAAAEAEDELENLRSEIVVKSAETICGHAGPSDDYDDAWEETDSDAPPVKQVLESARRCHAGDSYLERLGL